MIGHDNPIAIVMHFLQAGRKRATLPGTEESMTTTIEFITAYQLSSGILHVSCSPLPVLLLGGDNLSQLRQATPGWRFDMEDGLGFYLHRALFWLTPSFHQRQNCLDASSISRPSEDEGPVVEPRVGHIGPIRI